ncbi:MAG TPA: hypothetical protein VM597_02650 [Gemmataceae bacterium]|nr:hypothetical protein [Gemmataceae bacterium]
MPDPQPAPLCIRYDRLHEANLWAQFAAAALGGHNAHGFYDSDDGERMLLTNEEAVEFAVDQADSMMVEFRARFHHDPEAKNGA